MDIKPKNLFKRVFEFALGELERRARPEPEDGPQRTVISSQARTFPEVSAQGEPAAAPRLGAPAGGELDLERVATSRFKVSWDFTPDQVARAASLVEPEAVLCLRVVSFSAGREDVAREVQDRPGLDRQGSCEVQAAGDRVIVAYGLRAGERFVALRHHVL